MARDRFIAISSRFLLYKYEKKEYKGWLNN